MVKYYVNPDQIQNSTYLDDNNTAGQNALKGNGFQEVTQDQYNEARSTGKVSNWNQPTVAPGIGLTNTADANKSAQESAAFQQLNNPTLPSPGSQSVSGQNGYNNNTLNPPAAPSPNSSSGGSSPATPATPVASVAPVTLPDNPFSQNLSKGSSGNEVSRLQQILNTQGANLTVDGKYGPLTEQAVKDFQTKNGLTVDGVFGPKSSGALTTSINAAGNPSDQPGSSITTPLGRIDSTAPVSLSSGGSSTFDSSSIGTNSTADVLNTNQNRQDDISSILQKQADAFSVLNQLKGESLQGKYNIMYGRGGAGGSDADLQGKEQQMFDEQMAFKTTPAEIAYNSAQMAVSLFQKTPAYLTETQARDTAFNLLQNYGDINYAYDPSLSAQQNLQNIKEKLPSSARYQASLMNMKGYYDTSGNFHMYNAKDTSGTPVEAGGGTIGGGSVNPSPNIPAPNSNNPVTPTGTYLGTAPNTTSVSLTSPITPKSTSSQVTAWKDWTSGGVADARNNLNTAIGHLFEANQVFPQIKNSGNTIKNALGNTFTSIFNANSPVAGALKAFSTAQSKASGELSAAYNQDTGTERTLAQAESGTSSSQTQWTSYLNTSTKLLVSKLASQADSYRQSFGHYPPSLDALISPINQVKLAAFSGLDLKGIAYGVPVSPSTQAMLNSAVVIKEDKTLPNGQVIKAGLYLPDAKGNAILQQ